MIPDFFDQRERVGEICVALPGNPTIISVDNAMSGMASRNAATSSR